jgi:hypothetical protein
MALVIGFLVFCLIVILLAPCGDSEDDDVGGYD